MDVKVKAGDKVKVGQALLSVEDGASAQKQAETKQPEARPPDEKAAPKAEDAVAADSAATGPADGDQEQRVEGAKPEPAPDRQTQRAQNVVDISRGARAPAEPAAPESPPAPAAPSVRRMARELGVDINEVPGSGPSGRISVEDVKGHAKRILESARQGGAPAAAIPLPDFSRFGEIERQPMRAVRRKTAEHLSAAWAAIPHVTQFDVADITGLEELRKKYAKQVEAAGGNLTVTSIAVKIVAAALKVF